MPFPKQIDEKVAEDLLETIEGALDLLGEFKSSNEPPLLDNRSALSLMEQCLALCEQQPIDKQEPIRVISHLACTGGTLFSKCIAAMPNVQLLSEISPFSTMHIARDKPSFAPTDIIKQMRQSTRGTSDALISKLFLNNLGDIYAESSARGQRLVLRDHAHSQFCTSVNAGAIPTLSDLVSSKFCALSIVTVRHPIQSFISLDKHKWIHFRPANFDEYCKRYLAFLRAHAHVPIFRYEDLVRDPAQTMRQLCADLQISFSDQFPQLFDTFKLTGDSGRGGGAIEPIEDKKIDEKLAAEVASSIHYPMLIEYLDYD